METRQRTLVKAGVWTLIGLVVMAVVGWIFTGSVAQGGGMALVNATSGMITYVIYERIWDRVRWGRPQ